MIRYTINSIEIFSYLNLGTITNSSILRCLSRVNNLANEIEIVDFLYMKLNVDQNVDLFVCKMSVFMHTFQNFVREIAKYGSFCA